jgi:hypothetical protein
MENVKLQTPDFCRERFHKLCTTITSIQPESNTQSTSIRKLFLGLYRLGLVAMKNVYEVLRNKELDLARLRTEVDALRFVAPLLTDGIAESSNAGPAHRLDITWTPDLQKNKWPLRMDHASPTYSDS